MKTTKVKKRKKKDDEEKKKDEKNRPVPVGCLSIVFFLSFDRQTDIDKSLVDIRKRLELLICSLHQL